MSHSKTSDWTLTNQRTGEVIPLTGAQATIGRQAGNTIVLTDSHASRHHATISWQGETYVVQDEGSVNGTFLDGQRITGPEPLRAGAVLRLAESTFVVSGGPAVSAGRQEPVPQPVPQAAPPPTSPPRSESRRPLVIGVALTSVAIIALIVAAAALLSGSGDEPSAFTASPMVVTQPLVAVENTPQPAATATPPPATVEPLPSPSPTEPSPSASPAKPVMVVTEPTSQPTYVSPSPTPSPRPSPTPDVPAVTLLAPTEAEAGSLSGQVTFRWAYPQPLQADQAFQILIWKEGQSHDGAAELWTGTEQTIDLDVVLPQRGGSGEYFWTVVVRHKDTHELLSPEAGPWRLVYAGAGAAPPTYPPPNRCAGVCDDCQSWNWRPICDECSCPKP
ncbi:MAG: FHA domain-containing protein [Anaerolineae bacterium]